MQHGFICRCLHAFGHMSVQLPRNELPKHESHFLWPLCVTPQRNGSRAHADLVWFAGGVDEAEMFRTFNMGVGMAIIVPAGDVGKVLCELPKAFVIGKIAEGKGVKFTHEP